ncbi:BTB/POZ-like [Macleaya cordata]|uniref:BTB/POZ-like n=1 Tax=Macleaya cordata TaxID=56857 RepID=A0A200QTA1_MACCD|nr:BTB/POZ-like [Macleaya cordata]
MAHNFVKNNSGRLSLAMERTGQWVFSQEIPTDVVVEVGEANFALHKFMLVEKSGYIRRMIMETNEPDLARIDLSDIPGGPEIFEKAARFCYGVNFEITVHNAAALRCAAEYLEMTEKYYEGNLVCRTDEFLAHVVSMGLSSVVTVLKSCEDLLPMAEDLHIVQRCVDVASSKAFNEANFPSRSPTNWWTEELTILDINFFKKIISSMKSRGAKTPTIASALITYAEKSLRDLVRDHSGNGIMLSDSGNNADVRKQQKNLLESIVTLLPFEKSAFPVNFLCCLLRSAIYLNATMNCKNELEKRISTNLENATVDDLLILSFTYDGERLFDLESVRRIISGFVEVEKSVSIFNGGDLEEICSSTMQRVAKTVDAYLGEIGMYGELSISKFNGIANLVPKAARKVDDDLYRAVDIYLKAHPNLDEIEREKACSVMDPLKLSYNARVHASQNKRLPVQIVLHALYYDQLKLRSGIDDDRSIQDDAVSTRIQLEADVSLMKENETLRSELMKMKMYISDIQNNGPSSTKPGPKKPKFFSSVSKTLGKLNPFRHGSKDTSNMIDDGMEVITKPRRRRFSIS